MSDFTWPTDVDPGTFALTWADNTIIFRSPLSGTIRTESRSGGGWFISLTVNALMNESVISNPLHELEAFLYRLDGAKNRAVIKDFSYSRSGPGGGTPLVKGASQTGLSLITDGWSASTTVLYAGDRIGISDQMIPVVSDVTSNGAGEATLTLAHPIRTAPSDNDALEISDPTARYVLTNKASFATRPSVVKSALIEFEEAIP